jgi:hypothetical protein
MIEHISTPFLLGRSLAENGKRQTANGKRQTANGKKLWGGFGFIKPSLSKSGHFLIHFSTFFLFFLYTYIPASLFSPIPLFPLPSRSSGRRRFKPAARFFIFLFFYSLYKRRTVWV